MLPVPKPLNCMLCVPVIFSEVSVSANEPLKSPDEVGVKLMGNRQNWPAVSVADEEPGLNT